MDIDLLQVRAIVRRALAEDLGDGDVTSESILPPSMVLRGRFISKESGFLAGLAVAAEVFGLLDEGIAFTPIQSDGDKISSGEVIADVTGPARPILGGERVALNFMQRMSGIATATRRYVEAVKGSGAVILDTRKTAPSLRLLDKWAVSLGGGQNHRFGLYDMVLIKDNHIAAVGSIQEAVARVRAQDARKRTIVVEVTDLEQLKQALALGVDRVMLDNMSLSEMEQAVRLTAGRVPLEASGNITLENVAAVGDTGVDLISVGSLTHSVSALDISLEIIGEK